MSKPNWDEVGPELLEALKELEYAFARAGLPGSDIAAGPFADTALNNIRAAIAKATGETK